jgi:hypothetical protein
MAAAAWGTRMSEPPPAAGREEAALAAYRLLASCGRRGVAALLWPGSALHVLEEGGHGVIVHAWVRRELRRRGRE